MKKYIVVLVVAIFVAPVLLSAGEVKETVTGKNINWNKVEKAYSAGLHHQCPEVVESAIFQVTKINLLEENAAIQKLNREVKRLSTKGKSEVIRYQAYLATKVIENPEWIKSNESLKNLALYTDENRYEFFSGVAGVLNSELLSN